MKSNIVATMTRKTEELATIIQGNGFKCLEIEMEAKGLVC